MGLILAYYLAYWHNDLLNIFPTCRGNILIASYYCYFPKWYNKSQLFSLVCFCPCFLILSLLIDFKKNDYSFDTYFPVKFAVFLRWDYTEYYIWIFIFTLFFFFPWKFWNFSSNKREGLFSLILKLEERLLDMILWSSHRGVVVLLEGGQAKETGQKVYVWIKVHRAKAIVSSGCNILSITQLDFQVQFHYSFLSLK